ncbi:MAG: YjfB family protein [Undibacterium sp.]|nr:YjfB family protein [Undibacterium sp.]
MDINGIASISSSLANVGVSQQVSIAVLKKALDVSEEGAVALIEAIPNSGANTVPNLPPNLGRNVNTTA